MVDLLLQEMALQQRHIHTLPNKPILELKDNPDPYKYPSLTQASLRQRVNGAKSVLMFNHYHQGRQVTPEQCKSYNPICLNI